MSEASGREEPTSATASPDATAREWARKMFGGSQSSFGLVVAAVAAVIGSAIGNLLVRHYLFALAGLVIYGLVALGLYYLGTVRRSLSGLLRGQGSATAKASRPKTAIPLEPDKEETAPSQWPVGAGEQTGGGQASEEAWPRRGLSLRVRSGHAVLAAGLAACCYVLGYWGIGNGFAHGAPWGAASLLVTIIIVTLVARFWSRSRSRYLRYRASTAAMVCCVAAAGLSAGATLGDTNLAPPCPAPTELTVLTSAEDLAAVQAAIPGFEQTEPARVHTACYAVDVTAYAAPTDSDVWRGLETGWGTPALSTVGPRPDVWIPGSPAEVTEVREHGGPQLSSSGSIGSSPLVVAVPTGLISGPLARLAKLGSTWGSIYHGLEQVHAGLAIPNPAVSETALLGIAGLYPDLSSAEQHGIELAGSFPADSADLLCDAAQTAEGGTRTPRTAYLVSEAALIAGNADQLSGTACSTLTEPPTPLTAFYPVGAAALNFPFTTVNWRGGNSALSETLSRYETDFYHWLTGKARSKLRRAGLRPRGCGMFKQAPIGVTPVVPPCGTANLPTAQAVASAQGSFREAQAPAHILIGIDDSGPMQPYLPQITAAVDAELGPDATHLGSRDSFGIWKLPGDRKMQIDQRLVGFGAAGATVTQVPAKVGALTGHDHSADYAMLTQAGRLLYAQPTTDPEPSNSVILLTDGDGYPQGDPGGSSEVSVIGYFDRPTPGHSAIKLYIIAFGPDGCAESETNSASQSLAAFADATGGTCLQANGANPTQLLAQVLSQVSTGG